jgi:hypothetical protein
LFLVLQDLLDLLDPRDHLEGLVHWDRLDFQDLS